MMLKRKLRKGYNVIELLVVITAISLIAAIGYQGINILLNNIKAEQLLSQLKQIQIGMANYYADTGTYPTRLSALIAKDSNGTASPDMYDAVSVAYYGAGTGDPIISDYWAGPYVNGMDAQGDCIRSVVGYEICFGATYTGTSASDTKIEKLYTNTWDETVGGFSVKQDPSSLKFFHVLSVSGIESEMAIKIFESVNKRSIDVPDSFMNKTNIINNTDQIGVANPASHEKTKHIVYRYTEAY